MEPTQFHSFVLLAFILAATPGLDMTLVIKHALASGWRSGIATMLGVSLGSLTWTIVAAVGLVALIDGLAARIGLPMMDVLLVIGIGYMAWIGGSDIHAGLRDRAPGMLSEIAPPSQWHALKDGLAVNIFNPKVGLFYLTVVPQFIADGAPVLGQFMILGLVHIGIGSAILALCAVAAGQLHHVLSTGRSRRVILVASGVMILMFALVLTWQRLGAAAG